MQIHFPLLAVMAGAAAGQAITTVSDITYVVGVSNGGIGGSSLCTFQATFNRGGEPVTMTAKDSCDKFQRDSLSGGMWFDFDGDADGLRVRADCDVKAGDCGQFFDIRLEANNNYCQQIRVVRGTCPGIDFKRSASRLFARQEPPVQTAPAQCYGDSAMVQCAD